MRKKVLFNLVNRWLYQSRNDFSFELLSFHSDSTVIFSNIEIHLIILNFDFIWRIR
jgi:hypothetical protein